MARKQRIQFQGALYHVINRGSFRSDLFVGPGARSGASLAWLANRLQIGGAATLRSDLCRHRWENNLQTTA
jgi:hypothetical protein